MTDVTDASSFRIDLVNLCLWRSSATGEVRLELTPKTFDVLHYLAENTGRLVTHDELLAALWRGIHVQPEVLKSHILAIRNALGDKSSAPRFIETQRGRGYRFIGQINGLASPASKLETALELGAFAGRAEPVRELLASLQQAASGEPRAVFISGEPGIGKTMLIEQFLGQVRSPSDLGVAKGHCIEGFAGAEPYYPVLEALREFCKADRTRVVRALLELAPSWAAQMPDQISAGQRNALRLHEVPDARSRMVREACGLFERLATERTLVLVLEDLHWADYATIDFMSALCRRRSSAKLLLIGTYRPEDLASARHPLKQMTRDLALRKYCQEIELAPLSNTAIAELLTGRAKGEAAPSEFAQFIEERTGGNPLFMRVTLEYLLQRGDVARMADGWRPLTPLNRLASETPPTLARAIETKIDGMTNGQRRVLEAASVAGNSFDPISVAPAAEMDVQSFEAICEGFSPSTIRRDALLTLPNNQLVRSYAFHHAVYRQVIYDRIGEVRRAHLHHVIAERLEEIYPPDQRGDLAVRLAHHFSSARDWSRAFDYLRAALRVATSRFARRDVLAILDHASELAANLPDKARVPTEIELLERRGAIQAVARDPKARETFAELAAKAGQQGDIDTQCRALIGLAYTASWHDLPYSQRVVNEVLALCEKQSDPIQRDVTRIAAYARRLWGSGWNRADARTCEDALARLRTSGDSLTIARGELNFGMLCLISTRYREAHDLMASSYRRLSESPQNVLDAALARAGWMRHIGVPWSLFFLGEFGAALADLDASITASETNGDPSGARYLQLYRGIFLFHVLDFEGVLEACVPVANSEADLDIRILPFERRIALIFSGLAEAGLGNDSAALNYLRTAESEMNGQPVHLDWYWRFALEWGMVNVLIRQGDPLTALVRAERLCDLTAQTDERAWQAFAWEARARAALSCGDASEASDHVANALAVCEGVQAPLAEWRAHATAAMTYKALGDVSRGGTHDRLGAAVRRRLAESLPEGHALRLRFERLSEQLSTT
jgi:DNA-binding winged helix-turn-helix (wHTH) protein